jgi:hypothetical protein
MILLENKNFLLFPKTIISLRNWIVRIKWASNFDEGNYNRSLAWGSINDQGYLNIVLKIKLNYVLW